MAQAVIVSAVRTPIGVSFRGTLRDTTAETLATLVVAESLRRSGVGAELIDDVIFAEALYGGGDLARYAAVAAGLTRVPGQAINRHCAGSLTAVGNAAASIRAGMDQAVIAGGAMSMSMAPELHWRVLGSDERKRDLPLAFPYDEKAGPDVTITTGFSSAQELGLTRAEQDAWALRSHQRAVAAIEAGVFDAEIVPVPVTGADGSSTLFSVDEGPRRGSTAQKLAGLPVLHPEIEDFSITAGNSSQVNDGAAALVLVSDDVAAQQGLRSLARVRAWAAVGVEPFRTGMGATEVIPLVLKRAGLDVGDVDLWEINEAFAAVPLAACRSLDLDEERVNIYGSGCSLGHPVAATGARMLTTLTHELNRRGGGIGVAAMCAGGGMGGALVIEVG